MEVLMVTYITANIALLKLYSCNLNHTHIIYKNGAHKNDSNLVRK